MDGPDMTACGATIVVGGETLTCNDHEGDHGYASGPLRMQWSDGAPGASPHQDPTPTYRASQDGASWKVTDGEYWQASFRGGHRGHPDPEGAAEAEAARLNGNPDSSKWLHIYCRVAERARESERDEARAEADRYREALQAIAHPPFPTTTRSELFDIARRVLAGGEA